MVQIRESTTGFVLSLCLTIREWIAGYEPIWAHSPDWYMVACGWNQAPTVSFYNIGNGSHISFVELHNGDMISVQMAIAPNHSEFVCQSIRWDAHAQFSFQGYSDVVIASVADGNVIRKLPAPPNTDFMDFAYSADGHVICARFNEKGKQKIRIWKV